MGDPRWLRTFGSALAVADFGLVGVGGLARACVPKALVTVQPHRVTSAGYQGHVTGKRLRRNSTIDVRWMKADGPRLATANGANFTGEVSIPTAPDGIYSIVVGAAAGAAVSRGRRPSPA